MHRLILVRSAAGAESLPPIDGAPPIDAELLARHAPDVHWAALDDRGRTAARCSLWWSATPALSQQRVGLVGHYGARDASAAVTLLEHACRELGAHGCTMAIGPMDGSTWRRYRLLTERGSEPAFFLEPDNPDEWPAQFAAAGFAAVATYSSALADDLAAEDPRLAATAKRLEDAGVRIRPLDLAQAEDELRGIHRLSLASFRANYLYTPIGEAEFLDLYRPILPFVRPELVLLAEWGGALAGFLFAVPDMLQAQRGEALDTVILKSMAVLPERTGVGLGGFLIARAHAAARALGFRRAIHALMHDANRSRIISGRYARVVRRYTLFGRVLTA